MAVSINRATQIQVLARWNEPPTLAEQREANLQYPLAHPRQLSQERGDRSIVEGGSATRYSSFANESGVLNGSANKYDSVACSSPYSHNIRCKYEGGITNIASAVAHKSLESLEGTWALASIP